MIIKIFPEKEPNTILFVGTECMLREFLTEYSLKPGLLKSRLIMEEISKEDAQKTLRTMREFSTSPITQHGKPPWST